MSKKILKFSNWMGSGIKRFFEDKGYEIIEINHYIKWKKPDIPADWSGFVEDAKKSDIFYIGKGFHYKGKQLETHMIKDIKSSGTYVVYGQLDIPNTVKNATTFDGMKKYYREFWQKCDLILFPYQESVDLAKENGIKNVEIWHPGYDEVNFDGDYNAKYSNRCDVTFVGKCYGDRSPFPRAKMVKRLIDEGITDIRLYGWYWTEENAQEEIAGHLVQGDKSLKPYYYGELGGRGSGEGMVSEGFCRGKITLSSSLLSLTEYTPGRLYETMGLGKCTLSNYSVGMENLGFVDGETIVFFSSIEDLVDKTKFYLAHEKKRNEIGENARKLIFDRHLQKYRGQQIWDHYNGK